jgi:hypothetical protein
MRLPLALLWVTLCACRDPFPAHNPAPPPPQPVQVVVPQVAPQPTTERVPEPPEEPRITPAWSAWSEADEPEAAELQGSFELSAEVHESSGIIGFISVRGDKSGAVVTSGETCGLCRDKTLRPYARGTVPAAKARELISELKRLKFWAINDGMRVRLVRSSSAVFARVGETEHRFDIGDGCRCKNPLHPDCTCPQEELLDLLTDVRDHAAKAALAAPKAFDFPTVAARQVVRVKGSCQGNPKAGYRCSYDLPQEGDTMVDQEFTEVELPWCRATSPKVFSCFQTAFDTTRYLLTTTDDITALNDEAPEPAAAKLRSGEQCQRARDGHWSCDQATQLELLEKFGSTWIALGPDGRDLDLMAVYLH